jgi:hypothetical protein
MVQTRPEGATVYRESDGVRLGKTPLEVRARRGRGEAAFILRKTGYRTERLALPVDQDQDRIVTLRRGMTPPPPATTTKRGVPEPDPDADEPGADTSPDEKTVAPPGKPAAPQPVKERGKDDALDPFKQLLRPTTGPTSGPTTGKTDAKRATKPTGDADGEAEAPARDQAEEE